MPRGVGERMGEGFLRQQDCGADNNSNHSHVFVRFFLLLDDRPSPRSFAPVLFISIWASLPCGLSHGFCSARRRCSKQTESTKQTRIKRRIRNTGQSVGLQRRLLIRITGLRSGCIRHFSIWRWALQARLQDLLSGSSAIRRFSCVAQGRRAPRVCLLFSSITWFASRTLVSHRRHSSRWKQK
jgi:hypothetical protein